MAAPPRCFRPRLEGKATTHADAGAVRCARHLGPSRDQALSSGHENGRRRRSPRRVRALEHRGGPGASAHVELPRPHAPGMATHPGWRATTSTGVLREVLWGSRAYFSSMSMTWASELLSISVAWSAASIYIAWPAFSEMSMV